jgi:iron(III) transport system substrate-binding protein
MRKIVFCILTSLILGSVSSAFASELVIYSARKEHLVKPLFEKYENETGVRIKFITGKAPVLLQRIISEGKNTPADMLITVDAGNLWHASNEGVLSTVASKTLSKNIPTQYRDPKNRWFGLSVRARTIVYNSEKVKPEELSTYEDLASPSWKGRLLLRTSKKVYNQSLVAMLIAENGADKTAETVKGWVRNLAAPPFSSDTKVLEAIAAGQGDVGVVNTYYFGRLLKKKPNLPLRIFWPDQNGNGVHVNISGAGITKHSKNKEEAINFLEWLSSKNAQNLFADVNMEYPVNQEVKPHSAVRNWGSFKGSEINLTNAGSLQKDSIILMDKAGYK